MAAIGDAAAAAGGSAEDVNNVVNSFGRMATGAQLTLGPIRELEEKGVPALRILANEWGVAAEDLAKDISDGAIDSQKAIDTLTEGILNGTKGINGATVAYGGAAKNVGNTVSGAYANMRIAVARAGAKIIAVFADGGKNGEAIIKILNRVRETIDVVGTKAAEVAKRIVGSDGFGNVLDFFEKLPGRVALALNAPTLTAAFQALFPTFTLETFNARMFVADYIIGPIVDAFESLPHEQISRVVTNFIVKGIAAIAENIAEIVAAVLKAAPAVITGIIKGLYQAATDNPLDIAKLIFFLGLPGVGKAMAAFFGAMPFGSITAPLITGLTTAVRAGVTRIIALMPALFAGFNAAVSAAVAAPIAAAAGAALAIVLGVGLGVVFHKAIEKAFPEVNRALERFGGRVYDFFADLPGKWAKAFGGIGAKMYDVGVAAMEGIKRGASAVVSGWNGFWQNVGANAYDSVMNAINAKSPSKKFMVAGRSMVDGIVAGVNQTAKTIDSTLSGLTAKATVNFTSAQGRGPVPAFGGGAAAATPLAFAGASTGVVNNYFTINVPPTMNKAEVGKEVVAVIKAYEKGSGSGWRS